MFQSVLLLSNLAAAVLVLIHCRRVLKHTRETVKAYRDMMERYQSEVIKLALHGVELATRVGELERVQRSDPRAGYIPGAGRS